MEKKIKVLNLYAGIGGNRKLWSKECEVTAIEIDKQIADVYQDFFPKDQVIITDAHKYLLEHYKEFDFVWSSPPCQTHSRTNIFLNAQGCIRYPCMELWQEILFLKQFAKSPYVIENVIPYYEIFIKPTVLIDRHYFWSNFRILKCKSNRNFNVCNARRTTRRPSKDNLKELEKYHGIDISKLPKIYTSSHDYLQLLRNCVNPKLGLHIFKEAFKESQKELVDLEGGVFTPPSAGSKKNSLNYRITK